MKIGSYYIGEDPPEFTADAARNAKLSRGDRKRKQKAELARLQLADAVNSAFYNTSGKLKP